MALCNCITTVASRRHVTGTVPAWCVASLMTMTILPCTFLSRTNGTLCSCATDVSTATRSGGKVGMEGLRELQLQVAANFILGFGFNP